MTSLAQADHRPLVALDWSVKCIHVTFDGVAVEQLAGVEELLERLGEPHRVVAESTFESWDCDRKAAMVALIRDHGHELYVFRPRNTGRVRRELDWTKSDENDARVIYRIAAQNLKHIYPLPSPDPDWVARRAELNEAYQEIRLSGDKDALAAAAQEILGRYRDLDAEAASVLGNGKTYSTTLCAVLAFAATHCTTRAELEQLLGLHGSAYPSLIRSEVLNHCYRWARKRGVTWTTYRRQVRRAFRILKDAQASQSTQGTQPVDAVQPGERVRAT